MTQRAPRQSRLTPPKKARTVERLRIRPGARLPVRGIARAAALLRDGQLVAIPTDTFYGIAADPRSDSAVRRLLRAKGRKEPPPLIAAGLEQVKHVAKLSGLAAQLASHFWPGPLTLVLPARPGRLCKAVVRSGTIAIRVPRHRVARALAKALGSPLTATSANRTGRPPARSASQVDKNLGAEISLIIDGGFSAASSPSTIVAPGRGKIEVVRQGCIAAKQISKFLDRWSDDC